MAAWRNSKELGSSPSEDLNISLVDPGKGPLFSHTMIAKDVIADLGLSTALKIASFPANIISAPKHPRQGPNPQKIFDPGLTECCNAVGNVQAHGMMAVLQCVLRP
jgi:hypothetical protein